MIASFSLLELFIAVENCHIAISFVDTKTSKRKLNLIRFEFAHDRNFVYAYFLPCIFSSSAAFLETRESRSPSVKTSGCHVHVLSRMFMLTSNAKLIVFRGRGVLNLQECRVTLALRYYYIYS